ncbi:MAG: hypothetical protein MI724_18190, partial [Spirochaetales bacterium]|nr:hypothetical protein [Spirochaetales bacterium]
MSAADFYFEGSLTVGDHAIPVRVRHASRYSLWLRFEDGTTEPSPTNYSKLSLQIDGKLVETGPCVLTAQHEEGGNEFRVVPL